MARESFIVVQNADGKVEFVPKHLYVRPAKHGGMQIIKDMEPYQNISVDGKVVGGRRQHRDMLRAHGLIEVGDQAPTRLPPEAPNRVDLGLVQDIKRAMGKL